MADFTSVASGNWADGATWGNASPGTAGVDYPGADLDTATIAAGHVVSYDLGDSAVNFGSITVNGKLSFPTAANSTLRFDATGMLTVNAGGELEVGTELAPVGAAYHARLYWAQGSSARYVFITSNGAIINIYGDPAYYSATRRLTLAADWDASVGDTLYVQGDQTATWPVGAKFYLNKGYASGTYATSTSYQTDADIFEIASVGAYDSANDRTPITVVAGHGSTLLFLSGQHPLIISRNVELGDPGAPMEVYGYSGYSEYLRWDCNQVLNNRNTHISNTVFFGWDRANDGGRSVVLDKSIFVSCNYAFINVVSNLIDVDIVSCYAGLSSSSDCVFSGGMFSCYYGNSSSNNLSTINADVVSCYRGLYGGTLLSLDSVALASNAYALQGTSGVSGDVTLNNNYYSVYLLTMSNLQINEVDSYISVSSCRSTAISGSISKAPVQASSYYAYSAICEKLSIAGVFSDYAIYGSCGNVLPAYQGDADWVAPPSSAPFILEMLPNSYCTGNTYSTALKISPEPSPRVAVWATTASTSVGFSIYPVGWATDLTDAEIKIIASYLDSATGGSRTETTTATATFANGVWSVCSASISPAQDGIVYINIELGAYESGAYVLIDPEPVVA